MRICLHLSASLPLNALFRQSAGVSHLRHHITLYTSNGILTVSAIGFAYRLILRTRLTPGRLTLPGKPWSFGGRASYPPYRYLCLHLRFQKLQRWSPTAFYVAGMLPYRYNQIISRGFGGRLIPDYYPCRAPRPVSCYALFE